MAFMTSLPLSAQVDTLDFITGDFLIGEVKKMERGVLVAETEYSDSDFKIEWDKVIGIRTQSRFLITITGGKRYYGRLFSLPDSAVQILTMPFEPVIVQLNDIVYLEAYDEKFKDRFSASIDLGFDMAKARTLRTLSSTAKIGYHADTWTSDLSLNLLRSTQDEVDDMQRTEAQLNFRYVLPGRWYAIGTISELSNTEQQLDYRMNGQVGMGRFFVRTNRLYWGVKLGMNRNIEQYSNDTPDRQSWEGYVGTELSLYNMGDIDLLFNFMAYPGITENGRFRSDSKLDITYDLPLDFYVKLGVSFNYDNQPAEDASKLDYIFQFGFGWEW
jgi:putative salt-induced outer membrane protein YdiY